jgi:predicted nucleotidyltransferase
VLAALRTSCEEVQKRFGVSSLRVFGSVARDDASADSDVDILVDFEEAPTFLGFMRLRFFLEDLLGAKVDLITETGLKEGVRPYVEKDAIRVA